MGLIALPQATPVVYVQSRQQDAGGFAEPGGSSSPQLTAWAVLGLRAARAQPRPGTLAYLQAHEGQLKDATDVELAAMAESALGGNPSALLARIERARKPSGAIGGQASDIEITVNEIRKLKRELYEVVNVHTGKSVEQIEKDFDRDNWMTAAEAKEYGLVDEVLLMNPRKAGKIENKK